MSVHVEWLILQTSNDPKDLEGPQLGGGLNSNPEVQAFNTPGPYIPSADVLAGVEQPQVRLLSTVLG